MWNEERKQFDIAELSMTSAESSSSILSTDPTSCILGQYMNRKRVGLLCRQMGDAGSCTDSP